MEASDPSTDLPSNENLPIDEQLLNLGNAAPVNYYAILNVPENATPTEIKDAYRSLARTFHPDKHQDPHVRTAAQIQFLHIQRAHLVLTDPVKRTLYDLYGPACPELNDHRQASFLPDDLADSPDFDSLEVAHVLKTPEDIRREFQDRIRTENLSKLENLIRQRGDISIQLDATPLLFPSAFDPPIPREILLKSLQVKYATHTPVDDTFVIGLSGRMMTQGSRGLGSIRANFRKAFTNLTTGEFSFNLLSPHAATTKIRHVLHEPTDTAVETDLHWSDVSLPPTGTLTLTRRLVKNRPIFGILRFYSGQYAIGSWGKGTLATQITNAVGHTKHLAVSKDAVTSLQLGVQWNHGPEDAFSSLTLQTSMFEQTVVVRHLRKLGPTMRPWLDMTVHGDSKQGSLGVSWKLGHTVGDHLRLAVGTSASSSMGIVVSVEVGYLGQKLIVPVTVMPGFNLAGFVLFSSVPLVSATLAWLGVLEPRRKRRLKQKLNAARDRAAEVFATRRADALAAKLALRSAVASKYRRESDENGLVILQALYGRVGMLAMGPDEARGVIDVTVPVFALCSNHTLCIQPCRSKAGLIGFYDPAPWEDKQLLVTYSFRGVVRQVRVEDMEAVAIPLRTHLVIEDPARVPVSEEIVALRDLP